MTAISFEWDENKNIRNKRVHGVSFEEAQTSFYDEDARLIPDFNHSENEERFLLLGYSSKARLLTVCHCYRKNDDVIRLISARKATGTETKQYYHFKGQPL